MKTLYFSSFQCRKHAGHFLISIVSQSDYTALGPAMQIIRKLSCSQSPHYIKLTTMNWLLSSAKNNHLPLPHPSPPLPPLPHWTGPSLSIHVNSVVRGQVCSSSLSESNWNSLGCKAGLHLAQRLR